MGHAGSAKWRGRLYLTVVTIAKGEAGSKACQSKRWQQKAVHAITCTQAHLLRGELQNPQLTNDRIGILARTQEPIATRASVLQTITAR